MLSLPQFKKGAPAAPPYIPGLPTKLADAGCVKVRRAMAEGLLMPLNEMKLPGWIFVFCVHGTLTETSGAPEAS